MAVAVQFDREHARAIKNTISAINPFTRYRVEDDKLIASALPSLTDEQRILLSEHKEEIITLLMTPPSESGQCIRGHEINWQCTQYGDWVCGCYFAPYVPQLPLPGDHQQDKEGIRDYWLREVKPCKPKGAAG